MSGLLLRLAGPLQSWGERSVYESRDTAGFPTRSGMLGLIAAAMGRPRGSALADFKPLCFTVRIDRPGVRIVDYHTAGGALPPPAKIPTADEKGRPTGKGTIQTWREYLADAAFTVAIEGPQALVDQVRTALRAPHWQPYLGRRSCPPNQPLLLDRPVDDPVTELKTRVPLARTRPATEHSVAVDFVFEDRHEDATIYTELRDDPDAFTVIDRTYRDRPLWQVTHHLSHELCAPRRTDYLDHLATYVTGSER
ncbi:type I-E CRISPR-associated protein Cas5/CasD [Salinactinospora qingdaonensis]|uniref:CRISPR system Cascade subunit CasD n=1 Tax=Salinactinospora qingdaonensis TaxID=702744 RepID=A0ABP7G6A7_9ACTN